MGNEETSSGSAQSNMQFAACALASQLAKGEESAKRAKSIIAPTCEGLSSLHFAGNLTGQNILTALTTVPTRQKRAQNAPTHARNLFRMRAGIIMTR